MALVLRFVSQASLLVEKVTPRLLPGRSFETQLSLQIESGDADSIMQLQKALNENSVRRYACRSKILRLTRDAVQQDRQTAISDHDALEQRYKDAARKIELAQQNLQDAWVEYQQIGVALFGLEAKIDQDRIEIGATQKQLGEHIAMWKENVYARLAAESACDY